MKQATAVCFTPASKAEFLGYTLVQQIFRCLEAQEQQVGKYQEMLLDVFNGNHNMLSGVFGAVEGKESLLFARSTAGAQLALAVISPLCVRILIDAEGTQFASRMASQLINHFANGCSGDHAETCETKLVLLHLLQRIAWQSGHGHVKFAVTRTLVAALELSPRRVGSVQSYRILVSVLVDLLVASDETPDSTKLIATTCEQIVARVRFFLAHQIGVLQLLQALVQLAEFGPDALWSSSFLFSCAHVVVTSCDSSLEKQLLLSAVSSVLKFGKIHDESRCRRVLVECLIIPLISVLPTHAEQVSPMLQLVMEMKAQRHYVPIRESASSGDQDTVDAEALHLGSFLRLIDDEEMCLSWLSSLFADTSKTSVQVESDREEMWLALLLGTLLFDGRQSLRDHTIKAFERQVQREKRFWSAATTKLLVSSFVFLVSQRPLDASAALSPRYAEFVNRSFYVLALLAAATTDTMKIILRFIKRMNSVASMQSMALRLLYVVWERESRVYSRLEALLHQERLDTRSTEYDLVKMATIESLCKKDAELGVEYISHIQASLEDERVSVVAMAVNAIESLCKADCLDFYAAFKIIALKMKKKKLQCVEEPLFLERLCVFYALGAAETDANKRQAAKLLEQLWELTGSASASVRRSSFESLNVYSLMALGLSVQENRGAVIGNSDDEDDEDDVTEDDVSEKLDELVESLKSEVADGVRSEIEKLLARVLEHESTKLNSGNGRGQAVVSSTVNDQRIQQRISAVATREMKKKFPSCREVIELYGAEQTVEDWDGFLLAYEEKEAIEYSSVKRKDKLVKLASQNVADMEANLSVILSQQVAPWEAESDDRVVFLRVQSLMEGWQAFMAKYVDAVDELSTLKLTIGASAEDGDQHFAEQIAEQIASQDRAPGGIKNERLRMIAVGALTGQLRDSKRWTSQLVQQFVSENTEKLSNRLSRAIEETKVFPNENHHLTALSAVVGLHLALGNRPLDSVKETMTEVHLRRLELVLLSLVQGAAHPLLQAVSTVCISHLGWLHAVAGDAQDRLSLLHTQERVRLIACSVLKLCLRLTTAESNLLEIAETVFSGEPHDSKLAASSDPDEHNAVVAWASLMGLARLSSGFTYIQKPGWLANLNALISQIWRQDTASAMIGVALGPVLLECVKNNLVSAPEVEQFASGSFDRLKTSVKDVSKCFHLLALNFLVCRMPAHGCAVRHEHAQALIEQARATLASGTSSKFTCQLALAGLANCFNSSLGIIALGNGPTHKHDAGTLELTFDPSHVESTVALVRSAMGQGKFRLFILGAISAVRDVFFVTQKKKMFDAEILTLPSKGVLFKVMDILRKHQDSDASVSVREDRSDRHTSARLVKSVLSCVTSISAVLPPLDYESLVHRLIKRFCDTEVTISCIGFAMTQGVCDAYIVNQWYAHDILANLKPRVQHELVSGLLLLAGRVDTATFERLVKTASETVLSAWESDARFSDHRVVLVERWIDVLGQLLARESTIRVSAESREIVKRVVVQQILPRLQFIQSTDADSAALVRRFAKRILAEIPRQEGVEDFVLGTPSETSSSVQPLQRATIFAELLRLGAVFSSGQASTIFQWVLRQDFTQWRRASSTTQVHLLNELSSCVMVAGAGGRPSQDTISWLLEVIDAFSRTLRGLSSSSTEEADAVKRDALFTFLAGVCCWKSAFSYERHAALSIESSGDDVSDFVRALPIGLLREFGANESFSAMLERLWAVHQRLQDIELQIDAIDYRGVLRAVMRQVHVEDRSNVTEQLKHSIVRYWSLDGCYH